MDHMSTLPTEHKITYNFTVLKLKIYYEQQPNFISDADQKIPYFQRLNACEL